MTAAQVVVAGIGAIFAVAVVGFWCVAIVCALKRFFAAIARIATGERMPDEVLYRAGSLRTKLAYSADLLRIEKFELAEGPSRGIPNYVDWRNDPRFVPCEMRTIAIAAC